MFFLFLPRPSPFLSAPFSLHSSAHHLSIYLVPFCSTSLSFLSHSHLIHVIFKLSIQFFGNFGSGDVARYKVIQNKFTVCGSCRSIMDIRVDVDDVDNENLENAVRFAYCSTCKKGHKLPRGLLAPNAVFCAICSYQAVTVTKPDGKSHTICPQCFKCVTLLQFFPLAHAKRHITSHHITSYHIISYYIISHHITSYHITSYQITSHHITSYNVASHHITSHHITLHHITSHHIIF